MISDMIDTGGTWNLNLVDKVSESRLLFRKDIMMIIHVVENKSVLYACLAFTTEQKL